MCTRPPKINQRLGGNGLSILVVRSTKHFAGLLASSFAERPRFHAGTSRRCGRGGGKRAAITRRPSSAGSPAGTRREVLLPPPCRLCTPCFALASVIWGKKCKVWLCSGRGTPHAPHGTWRVLRHLQLLSPAGTINTSAY